MRKVITFSIIVLFVCSALVSCRRAPETGPSEVGEPSAVRVATIAGYAVDYSDGSIGMWNSQYPHPSFDDEKGRRGLPNGEWNGSYYFKDDMLYLVIDNLVVKYPPVHTLGIGYTITLKDGTFEDGSTNKNLILYKYTGTPGQKRIEKGFEIIPKK